MSRDMSAFTTLDGANMGTREDFEKWAAEEGRSIKRSNPDYAPKTYASAATNNALDGWNARQPEIDALMRMQEEWIKKWLAVVEENDALKAENKRLRKDADRYRWLKANCFDYEEIGPGEPIGQGGLVFASTEVTQLPDSLDSAIDAAMKDFSTTKKEEWRGSEET